MNGCNRKLKLNSLARAERNGVMPEIYGSQLILVGSPIIKRGTSIKIAALLKEMRN